MDECGGDEGGLSGMRRPSRGASGARPGDRPSSHTPGSNRDNGCYGLGRVGAERRGRHARPRPNLGEESLPAPMGETGRDARPSRAGADRAQARPLERRAPSAPLVRQNVTRTTDCGSVRGVRDKLAPANRVHPLPPPPPHSSCPSLDARPL